jgi:hypothetical protein
MNALRFWGGIAAFAVLTLPVRAPVAVAAVAAAEPSDTTIAVLGLEALDGAPDGIASDITDALRQRVAATKGQQLVQGKDLVEVKLVFSCPDEAPECMSQAGKSMGASKMIFGNVKRSGTDYQVTLKLLDVARGTVESWAAESVPRRKAETQAFRALAPAWLSKLTGKGAGGTLQIRASVSGAAVSLDGTHVGTTGGGPVVVPDVAPGRHEVAVEMSGYTTTKQEFTLAAGQNLPLALSLSPVSVEVGVPAETAPVLVRKPDAPEEPSSGGGGSGRTASRAIFWASVVGTLTTAGLGLKYANDVQQLNAELDTYRRVPPGSPGCPATSAMSCNSHGTPAPDLNTSEIATRDSKLSQGRHAQSLETWFFVGTGVFAAVGGFFLYRGYLDGSGETTTAARGLRVFPSATASAGGIVTEFDF